MNITRIWKVYFSPTGNTDQAVSHLADALRDKLKCPIEKYDFTPACVTGSSALFLCG